MGEINPKIDDSWKSALSKEFENKYFSELKSFLVQEKKAHIVYPPGGVIFEALNRTPLQRVKVVILGQDPYHGPGQAHGLCFSVPEGVAFPPSLQNIFRELQTDLGIEYPLKGDLSAWADQGVLLLNATLTVRANLAGSHQGRGWEVFTDAVIRTISDLRENVVFLLWGKYAQNKKSMIDVGKHFVLEAPHPSPLSVYRGFFGCRHFSKTNEFLISKGLQPINWAL
jgi:uracil-DNA glycosylase